MAPPCGRTPSLHKHACWSSSQNYWVQQFLLSVSFASNSFVLSHVWYSPKNYALLVLKTNLSYKKTPCLSSTFSVSFSCVAVIELVEHRCKYTFKTRLPSSHLDTTCPPVVPHKCIHTHTHVRVQTHAQTHTDTTRPCRGWGALTVTYDLLSISLPSAFSSEIALTKISRNFLATKHFCS